MILQIISLFLFSTIIVSYINNSTLRKIFTLLLSIFLILEVFSIYIGGSLIDYKFYLHANINDILIGKSQFLVQGLSSLVGLFAIYCGIIYLAKKLVRVTFKKKKTLTLSALIFLSTIIMFIPNSIGRNIHDTYVILSAKDVGFDKALDNLGIEYSKYVKPDVLKAKVGKNIIIISMESIEKGFLNDGFKNVTPNLQRLSKELTFFEDMPQGPASGWTSASLYTFMTGVPAMLPGNGNEVFQKTNDVKLTGLGHIFKKAKYNSKFIISEADFAGTRDLVKAYKINVSDKDDMITKYPKAPWGLYDYDLFEEGKKFISENKSKGKNFALIMSTISTHFPHGAVDKRMKGKLPEGLTNHEFAIATLDYLVGDLIKYLKNNKLYDNTAIYIFPDHKLMGSGSDQSIFDRLGSNRKLYMITNVDSSIFSISPKKQIYQIDLPKLIIEGAEINTNATFLTDFIKKEDKLKFLKENTRNITELNKASLKKRAFKGGINISIINNDLLIKSEEDSVRFSNLNLEKGITKELFFDKNIALIKSRTIKLDDIFSVYKKNDYIHLIIKVKDSIIFTYLGDRNRIGISNTGINNLKIKSSEIESIYKSYTLYSNFKEKKKICAEKIYSQNIIEVTSSNYFSHSMEPTKAVFNGRKFEFRRGLNVIYKKDGIDIVNTFDTHSSIEDTKQLVTLLKYLHSKNIEYIVFAHDSASNKIKEIKGELLCLGYFDLVRLKLRQPYIAYYNNGNLTEYIGEGTISLILPWHVKSTDSAINNISIKEKNKWRIDRTRFIAHAGGEIKGKRYTNSLEALNENYKKGFRIFELDIMKSSDGKYIAEHDWKHWKRITKFTGETPISSLDFKKYKKYGKFTPLTIDDINYWFKKHKDAILVTDKVNTPRDFASKFVDKNRLIMELFSITALREGLDVGIMSAMPSENVLNGIKGDKVKVLKSLGVKNVAISRKSIEKNKALLLDMKRNGINVYVYHVNFGKEFDEEYVLNKEFKYVYGMYADKWNFKENKSCDK